MFDFDMAFVIVIGLITVLIGIINTGIKKIGNVLRLGGEEDRPDYDPASPPADPMLDDALEIVNRRWCKKHGYDYDEMFGDRT